MSIIKYLRKEVIYWIQRLAIKIDPRIEMARCYYGVFGCLPNFQNPKTLIEKIYWLQLKTDTSQWSLCADKYKVRDYLLEKNLGKYLNTLYGVWNSVDEIDFESLPPKCILKVSSACGQNIIYDRDKIYELEDIRKRLQWWLRHPFGASGGELHYLNSKSKIIAEKILPLPSNETSLMDYKIWCFSGRPFCILVVSNRDGKTYNLSLYDLNWKPMFCYLKNTKHAIIDAQKNIPRPASLNEMLQLAGTLSEGFPEVRVDLYEIDMKPVFGEMTFSTGFGYFTDEFYRLLGDKVVLNSCHK